MTKKYKWCLIQLFGIAFLLSSLIIACKQASTPTPTPMPIPSPAPPSPNPMQPLPSVPEFTPYEGTLIDVHSHAIPDLTIDRIISCLDKARVTRVVLMPRQGATDAMVLNFYEIFPDRIIPFIGFQNRRWCHDQDVTFPHHVESQLRKEKFKGLGEIVLRHYGVPERNVSGFDIPADSHLMMQIVDLAARYHVPVLIHHEAEDKTIPPLERTIEHNRETIVIWAHQGRADPDTIQTLLSKHPNLYFDIAGLDPYVKYGQEKNPIASQDCILYEKWKQLYETYSDRFLFGVDTVFLDHWDKYVEWVNIYRKLMGQLTPETAEKLGYKNAQKLLGL